MDEYGNEIEIYWDDDGNVSGCEITTKSGTYVYSVEEMQGSVNLSHLLGNYEMTEYAQKEEYTKEEYEAIRRGLL